MNKSRGKIDEGVTEDDMNEIKQDISAFRYELLEVLKNNGMDVSNNNGKNGVPGSKRAKRREAGRMLSFGYCVSQSNNKINLLRGQGESFGSSMDEFEFDPKKQQSSSNTSHHHNKLTRSKFGQIVMKTFHKHKSSSQDIADDALDVSLTTQPADLSTSTSGDIRQASLDKMVESPVDIPQCPLDEPLISNVSLNDRKHANHNHQNRRKLYALSKSQDY